MRMRIDFFSADYKLIFQFYYKRAYPSRENFLWLYNASSNACQCLADKNQTYWLQLCFDASNFNWKIVQMNATAPDTILWEFVPLQSFWLVGAPCQPLQMHGLFGPLFFPSAANLSFANLKAQTLPNSTWILPEPCATAC